MKQIVDGKELRKAIFHRREMTMKITRSKLIQIVKEEMDNLYSPQSSSADIIRTALEDSGELKDIIMETDLPKLMNALSEAEMPEAIETELKEAMYNAVASLNDEDVVQFVAFLRAK
jgi:hypothetical protein